MNDINLRRFIGIPWVKGGRSPSGYDCLGLAIAVRAAAGLATPDYVYEEIVPEEIDRDFRAYGFTRLATARPWCIVTFVDVPPYSSHLGVVLPDARLFIHTMSAGRGRSRIEHLDNPYWKGRRSGYWET